MASATWPDASEVRQWLAADETAKTMLRRLRERCAPSIAPMPPLHRAPLHGRNVLEIAGPSGSGKSELLLQSAVTCILPKEWDGLTLGGSEKPVLYLDLDCRFDMRRLVHLLECRIHDAESRLYDTAWEMYEAGGKQTVHTRDSSIKQPSRGQDFGGTAVRESVESADHKWRSLNVWQHGSSIKMLIKTCLQRFYLKRCHSSFELLVALKTIRAKLYEVAAEHGTSVELLIVDSIAAFYWLERTTRSVTAKTGRTTLNLWTVSEAVVNELRRVIEMHPKLLIMVSKTMILKSFGKENSSSRMGSDIWRCSSKLYELGHRKIPQELFRSDEHLSRISTDITPAEQSSHRDFLPASWRGFVTHRIILQGPYESELAPTDRFLRMSHSFFTAEWDKPFSKCVDFFVIQDVHQNDIHLQLSPTGGC